LSFASFFFKQLTAFFAKDGTFYNFVKSLGFWGYVVYASIYIVCTVCMVPGSLLTLAAGAIFTELYEGFLVISVGSTIGACLAFLLGRTVLKSWVENKIEEYKIFAAVDRAIRKKGFFDGFIVTIIASYPF